MGSRAVDGLAPARPAAYAGVATLVSATRRTGSARRSPTSASTGKRYELRARGSGRGTLRTRLAGERVRVAGRITGRPPGAAWMEVRHLVGRLDARSVQFDGPGGGALAGRQPRPAAARPTAPARCRPSGGRSSPASCSATTATSRPTLADDFRGSGLTHLLAVSGENVAFVLAVAGPVLRRLPLAPRWAVTLGVLAFFALVTRGEPSVLRAAAMAALATTAFVAGRPAPALRHLALAVCGLVLVDPLLVRSVGFRLSVAASVGILVIAPVLRRSLPGPAVLVEPFAVTAGAQLAVAPLLVSTFGGVPVASVPANLLAGPAAGLVMAWGLVGGSRPGVAGGTVAHLLHLPTEPAHRVDRVRWRAGPRPRRWVSSAAGHLAGIGAGGRGRRAGPDPTASGWCPRRVAAVVLVIALLPWIGAARSAVGPARGDAGRDAVAGRWGRCSCWTGRRRPTACSRGCGGPGCGGSIWPSSLGAGPAVGRLGRRGRAPVAGARRCGRRRARRSRAPTVVDDAVRRQVGGRWS